MRSRTSLLVVVFFLSLIGTGLSASAAVLPAGTFVHVRTTQPIFASSARSGTRVRGVVDRRVSVRGRVVIPSGAPATLEVVNRSPNRQRVDLSLRSIRVGGTRYFVSTGDVRVGAGGRRGAVGTSGRGTAVPAGRGRTQLSVPAHTRLQFRVNRTLRMGR